MAPSNATPRHAPPPLSPTVFVRQGILLQLMDKETHQKGAKSRLGSFGVYRAAAGGQLEPEERPAGSSGLFGNYFSSASSAGGAASNHDGQTRELIRQCFLFTNHLILCTRTKDGKLRLLEVSGQNRASQLPGALDR